MKIAIAQLNYHIGNIESNKAKIIEYIKKAETESADVVVFSELSICGYPPLDLLDYDGFIDKCLKGVEDIAKSCTKITAIVGGPSYNKEKRGKRLYNTAFVLEEGKITHTVNKSLLPTYDIFDEYRHFEPEDHTKSVLIKGIKVALSVCEDLWGMTAHPLYVTCPMDELAKESPELMINISASPFSYIQEDERKAILLRNVKTYHLPLVYVNQVGAQTEILFDGGSLVMLPSGHIETELSYFKEEFRVVDLSFPIAKSYSSNNEVEESTSTDKKHIDKIEAALVMGISDYFKKMGFKQAVLGLSGGIDSAIVLVLAVKALGAENVRALLMPSQFSSDHSVSDAEFLAKKLNVKYDIIAIKDIYESTIKGLDLLFGDLPFNIAEENLQARIRGLLLMGVSNKFGPILLNTSNKSELSVGYGTLYGDMAGGLSVIGDLYKTQIFDLARHINKNDEIIPWNTINKPPSAELRPDQKDSDSLPDYETLDGVLFHFIEKRESLEDIVKKGFDREVVNRVIKLVNSAEYKRFQFAPILRISPKAFGIGRRMPLVAKYDL